MWDPGFCQPSTCHNRTSSGSHSENGVPRSLQWKHLKDRISLLTAHFQVWLWQNPMDCSPPDSSVHEFSQARILEWVPISSSRGSFPLRLWAALRLISYFGTFFLTVHSRSLLCDSLVSISSFFFHLLMVLGISSVSWETPSGAPSLVPRWRAWHGLANHMFHWPKWLD